MSFRFFLRAARVVAVALFIALPVSARADAPPTNSGKPQPAAVGATRTPTTPDATGSDIKIGSFGANCTKTIEGALRYASGKLQLCDGSGWRNLAFEPAP